MADSLPVRQDRYLVLGDGADFAAVSSSGDWPASTRMVIESAAGAETSFVPTIATTTATWSLTAAQATALVGTRTSGTLRYRITTGTGADATRGVYAGLMSIKSEWDAGRGLQTLATVVVGPTGESFLLAEDGTGGLSITSQLFDTLTEDGSGGLIVTI